MIEEIIEEDRELTKEERNIKNSICIPYILEFLDLTLYDYSFYSILLYVIKSYGNCRLSVRELKDKTRLHMTKIISAKKNLSKKFDELGGLPLITVKERFSDDGKQLEDEIFVTNIDEANRLWCEKNIEKLKSWGFALKN